MLTILIIAALVVAVGGAGAGAVAYRNEQKRRGLGGDGQRALPAVGDTLIERGLRELRVGDVVTVDGKDLLCEGAIAYDEDGHRWVGARLVDGQHVVWCVVGIERVGSQVVRMLRPDPTDVAGYPPEVLVIGEVRFSLDKRGTATCKVTGDVGNLLGARAAAPGGTVERCRWWLYQSSGDDTAMIEQWGSDYRVLRGTKVAGDTIDLIPGS
ncbi:MAG: DUF4178 domain-containing protein [Myxococcales bacterium]|nr:DUF4178 domain-containing protein [Myxococcales bacterium]